MNPAKAKDIDPISYQALLNINSALQAEIQDLRSRLAEAEELGRAIREGDLDALVIPGSKGEMIFTLDSADRAYRVLVETMNEGTATIAFDGTILYCNRHFVELLKMPSEVVVGTSIFQFIAPEHRIAFKVLLKQEKGKSEINLQTEAKASLPVYLSVSSLKSEGVPNSWCLVATDLTEQKENERMLANIENIRKKEIHHRIKNNLQVISSLLDLQAEKLSLKECISNSEVLEAFKESQSRIASIALIHEELYKGGEIDKLKFSTYLEKLAENLLRTYALGNTEISLNMELEKNVFFEMDIAVPLGMVVNEIVSNSLKYAFPKREAGEIQIKLLSEVSAGNEPDKMGIPSGKHTRYTLIVSDDGIGIPEEIDFENSDTLGLQLVNILVNQLDGTLELKNVNGTIFIIKFSTPCS